MDFFTGFGFVADVIGFADALRSNLRNSDADWKEFLDSIKIIIKVACKKYRNFIELSPDHRDIVFPKEYEELLSNSVCESLKNNTVFTIQEVLPLEKDFPDSEKHRLFVLLKNELQGSFQYVMRTGQVQVINQLKALQTYTDDALSTLHNINNTIEDISPVIKEIHEAIINNSFQQEKKHVSDTEFFELVQGEIQYCQNSTLFPWSQRSIAYKKAFPKLFIHPIFSAQKTGNNFSYTNISNYAKKNLIFLGEAGAGKTTLFKYIFGFNEWTQITLKQIMAIYVDARSLMRTNMNNFELYINAIINGQFRPNAFVLLLIDCIDEAFFCKRNELDKLLRQLHNVKNGAVWLGCRTDYFATIYSSEIESFAYEKLILQPWTPTQANEFIKNYSELEQCPYIIDYIDNMIKNNSEVEKFKNNPFHLSLLVFLAQNAIDKNGELTQYSINTQYDLYDKFMSVWIKHERARGTSVLESCKIYDTLYEIARYVYEGKEYILSNEVTDSAIRDLLVVERNELNDNVYVKGFYHRSLSAFLLAHNVVSAMIEGGNRLLYVMTQPMLDDVTNFVREALTLCDNQQKFIICDNLKSAYRNCTSETVNTLTENEKFLIREHVIYYITRIGIDVADFIVDEFFNETNQYLRMNLAYGAVNLGPAVSLSEVTLQYAKKLTPGTDEELILRSWTMAYFNDVEGDPYAFRDTEKRPWTNARKRRLERFSQPKKKKDFRFFLFDIPLFRCFFESRDWSYLNQEELDIIENIPINKQYFTDEEYEFLINEKEKLVKMYKEKYFHDKLSFP